MRSGLARATSGGSGGDEGDGGGEAEVEEDDEVAHFHGVLRAAAPEVEAFPAGCGAGGDGFSGEPMLEILGDGEGGGVGDGAAGRGARLRRGRRGRGAGGCVPGTGRRRGNGRRLALGRVGTGPGRAGHRLRGARGGVGRVAVMTMGMGVEVVRMVVPGGGCMTIWGSWPGNRPAFQTRVVPRGIRPGLFGGVARRRRPGRRRGC